MIQYLPALGEHEPLNGYGTGLEASAIGVTSGLRTSWNDVLRVSKGDKDSIFKPTWFKDIVFRPSETSLCLFDSGLYSVFGLVKKDPSMDLKKFFSNYAPAYKDYINFVMQSIPDKSQSHCFFVNLDTDFLLGLDKTREFNDLLLKNCPTGSIVGTYHAADGKKYLDELIEKFDYIAVADTQKGKSFENDDVALQYAQSACEYIKNKRPEIKIHVLGRTDELIFKTVGNLADTCDSSSYRFFGEPSKLLGTDLKLHDFWASNFNHNFCGGMEQARSLVGHPMSEMQYSALVTETLQLYTTLALANKYAPQVVRINCPVRDAIDDFFGIPHSWWTTAKETSARYLSYKEAFTYIDGKEKRTRHFEFLPEAVDGAIDLGSTVSQFIGKRKQDWTREAPRPSTF